MLAKFVVRREPLLAEGFQDSCDHCVTSGAVREQRIKAPTSRGLWPGERNGPVYPGLRDDSIATLGRDPATTPER